MKSFLALLFSVCVLVTGCAGLDAILLQPKLNEAGVPLVRDIDASRAQGADVVIPADEEVPGGHYEPIFEQKPSGVVTGTGDILGAIPGWGWMAALGVSLFGGIYARIRGVGNADERAGLIATVLGDILHGKLDTDKDGKTSLAEIVAYAKDHAGMTVEFVTELIRVAATPMAPAAKTAALKAALALL